MSTAEIHITFPAPPPTRNALAPAERARLLRSTRKLGAVLGATPLLLEASPTPAPAPAPHQATAAAAAHHRAARLFHTHSPASSISSMSSLEPEYVLVKPTTRSAPYQPEPRPTPAPAPASGEKRRRGAHSGVPIALIFDAPGARGALSQPHLLRVAPSTITTTTAPAPTPLSPATSAFNIPAGPASPPLDPPGLNDRARRRKMAKLARTLGENVPPELVFRPAPIPPMSTGRLARSTSLFSGSYFNARASGPAPPVLAVAATPTPMAPAPAPAPATIHTRAASASTTATATARSNAGGAGNAQRTTGATGKRRAARPRSLALGAASAIAAADAVLSRRAAASLDAPRPKAERVDGPAQPLPAQAQAEVGQAPGDFGRRKEREWSGEWNVRDMDAVAKRLRGLKGR